MGGRLIVLVLMLCCANPSLAGTRLYRSLEEVLRRPSGLLVFSGTVVEHQFSQWESYDVLDCRVRDIAWLHGHTRARELESLRHLAYRPSPRSGLKNRSVYSDGSGLEFDLQTGQQYIFICSSSGSLVRVEPMANRDKILTLLESEPS